MDFILKSSLFVGILYSFYKLFLQKETFFKSIRFYFIVGLLLTLVFPLVSIPIYVDFNVDKQINLINPINKNNIVFENPTENKNIVFVENNNNFNTKYSTTINQTPFNWLALLKNIYFLGLLFFSIKFIIEISSLYRLVYKSNRLKKGNITFVETIKNIAPFSIFNYIVYNKQLFKKSELNQIIEHEKVHVTHKHSYDMLLVHLLVIVQWFNPFAWLYKKDVAQNLEFLADKFAKENHENIKEYQYLLLKTSVKNYPFALSTNFYNSLIKKRIIMLQKSPSKKLNQLKYILLLPLIALFLYAFNTKEIEKPINETLFPNLNFTEKSNEKVEFFNPIHPENVIKISSGFGKRTNPFTNKKQLHKGIDIVAYQYMDVYATAKGMVTKAAYDKLKGNYIQITHNDNYQTNYHHLGDIQVALGEQVKAGEIISTVGNSGKSTEPHLHYEVMKYGKNIDPKSYLKYNDKKIYTINSKTSKDQLNKIILDFKKNNYPAEIKFSNIKIENNKLIAIGLYTKTKNHTKDDFNSYMYIDSGKNGTIDEFTLEYLKLTDEFIFKQKNNPELKSIVINSMGSTSHLKDKTKIDLDGYNAVIQSKVTDKQLKQIEKKYEQKNKITVKIYGIKRNNKGKIIAIKIDGKSKDSSSSYSFSQNKPIPDILLGYDKSNDEIIIKNLTYGTKYSKTNTKESKSNFNDNDLFFKGKSTQGIAIYNKTTNVEIEKLVQDFKKKFKVNISIINIKRNQYNEIVNLNIKASSDNTSKEYSFKNPNSFYSLTINYNDDKDTFYIRSWENEDLKYVIKEKDTYYSIAQKHSISVNKLRELNPNLKFKVGQRLILKKDFRHNNSKTTTNTNSTRVIKFSDNKNNVTKQIIFKGDDNPLYIIDGIVTNSTEIKNLDASNIKSMSVLKGIDTSIYGEDGRNGVILIQTKSGSSNSNLKNYSDQLSSKNININIKKKSEKISFSKNNHDFINYKNETYYYNIIKNKTTFYNKFGETVNSKTAKKLLKLLRKKLH